MGGLNLSVGGFGGTSPVTAPQYGSAASYSSGVSATSAAFGGDFTTPTMSAGQVNSPKNPYGLAVWIGIGAVGALVLLRRSLPN